MFIKLPLRLYQEEKKNRWQLAMWTPCFFLSHPWGWGRPRSKFSKASDQASLRHSETPSTVTFLPGTPHTCGRGKQGMGSTFLSLGMLLRETVESWPSLSSGWVTVCWFWTWVSGETPSLFKFFKNNNKSVLFARVCSDTSLWRMRGRQGKSPQVCNGFRGFTMMSVPPTFCPAWAPLYIKGSRAGSQGCGKDNKGPGPRPLSHSAQIEAPGCEGCAGCAPRLPPAGNPSWHGASRSVAGLSLRIFLMSMGALFGLLSQFQQVLFVFSGHIDR